MGKGHRQRQGLATGQEGVHLTAGSAQHGIDQAGGATGRRHRFIHRRMRRHAQKQKLAQPHTQHPARAMIQVAAAGQMADPVVQQAEISQRGQHDVVQKRGIRPRQGGLTGFVIEQVRGISRGLLPGFENFNARVRRPGGFYLPNAAKERLWNTPDGRANFSAAPLDAFRVAEGRFLLQTLRSHDQFNTTVYGLDDRYRGISDMRDIVFLNPEDLATLGVKPGGRIDITSHWHDGERHLNGFRAIPYDMPRGMAAAYFPEANVLVPAGHVAEGSNTPASKSIEVSITPSRG